MPTYATGQKGRVTPDRTPIQVHVILPLGQHCARGRRRSNKGRNARCRAVAHFHACHNAFIFMHKCARRAHGHLTTFREMILVAENLSCSGDPTL